MDINKLFGDLQSQLGGNQDKIKTALSSANVPQDAFSDLGKQFPGQIKGLGSAFSGAFPQQSGAIGSQLTSTLQSANIQEVFSSRSGELNAFLGEGGADQIGGLFNNVQDLDIQGKFDIANERFADVNFGEQLGDINTDFEVGIAELSATLSSEETQAKLAKSFEKFKDLDVEKMWVDAQEKVEAITTQNDIQDKLSGLFKELPELLEQSDDKLTGLLEGGIDIPFEEMAAKAQMNIDKLSKDGSLTELGDMSKLQMDGLMTQMGKFNTGFRPDRFSEMFGDGIGKFNMGPEMLEDAGFLQKGLGDKFNLGQLTSSDIFNNPASWVGGGKGPANLQSFLGNPLAQHQGFAAGMTKQFGTMLKSGGILAGDSAEAQGGMLAISSKLGPAVAKAWRQDNIANIAGSVRSSVPNLEAQADKLFQNGRFGVSVLGAKK